MATFGFGNSSAAGQGVEYVRASQNQVPGANEDSHADLTDLIVIEGGQLKHSGSVHTRLLVESSKWCEEYVARIKNCRGPDSKVQILLHYSLGAVQIFIDYLHSRKRVPRSETFAKHGIEACCLSRFLQSPDFQDFCERTLDHKMLFGEFVPTILDLQSSMKNDLSKEIQNEILNNVVQRILAGKYEYNDDKSLIERPTQAAVDATVAKRMQASAGTTMGTEPTATAPISDPAKNNDISGGLFGSTQNQARHTGDLFGTGPGLFGNNQCQTQPASGLFGQPQQNAAGLFGNIHSQQPTSGGLFGSGASNGGGLFGNAQNSQRSGSLFGNGAGLFGDMQNQQQTRGSLFNNPTQGGSGLFGNSAQGGGLFGNNNHSTAPSSGGLFGNSTQGSGLFGGSHNQTRNSGGLFENPTQDSGGLFENKNHSTVPSSSGLFGHTSQGGGLFGNNQHQAQRSCGFRSATQGLGCFSADGTNYPQAQTAGGQPINSGGSLFDHHYNQSHTQPVFGAISDANGVSGGGFGAPNSGPSSFIQTPFSVFGRTTQANVQSNSNGFGGFTGSFGSSHVNSCGSNGFASKSITTTGIGAATSCICCNNSNTATGFGTGFGSNNGGFGNNNKNNPTSSSNSTGFGGCNLRNNTSDYNNIGPFGQLKTKPNNADPTNSNDNLLLQDFAYLVDREANGTTSRYLHICSGEANRKFSPEELRLCSYIHHGKPEILEVQESGSFKLRDATSPQAELDVLRAQVSKLEQDTSTLANQVYEMKLSQSALVDKFEKLEDSYENEPTDRDLVASTPAIVLTPTSSTTSTPSPESFAKLTIRESGDFVNVESSASKGKLKKTTHINNKDSVNLSREDEVWDRVLTVSPAARKVFAYLWAKPHAHSSFVLSQLPFSRHLELKQDAVDEAIAELLNVGIIHYNVEEDSLFPQSDSWEPEDL